MGFFFLWQLPHSFSYIHGANPFFPAPLARATSTSVVFLVQNQSFEIKALSFAYPWCICFFLLAHLASFIAASDISSLFLRRDISVQKLEYWVAASEYSSPFGP